MDQTFLLFDLDGTISDPLEGISRSINYALEAFGYNSQPMSEIAKYVGPPLDDTFIEITGSTDKSEINNLIEKYRERYSDIGYSENYLYPDVKEAIHTLADHDIPLAICTSKRRDFAEKIITKFSMREYFQFICGGDIGIKKSQQIKLLLSDKSIDHSAVMIGDRAVDLVAAHRNRLKSVGVLWGYGSQQELEAESPLYLLSQPAGLFRLMG